MPAKGKKKKHTGWGGPRKPGPGKKLGRPYRPFPKAKSIWIGQVSEEDRLFIIKWLTPQERKEILLIAAHRKAETETRKAVGEENAPQPTETPRNKENTVKTAQTVGQYLVCDPKLTMEDAVTNDQLFLATGSKQEVKEKYAYHYAQQDESFLNYVYGYATPSLADDIVSQAIKDSLQTLLLTPNTKQQLLTSMAIEATNEAIEKAIRDYFVKHVEYANLYIKYLKERTDEELSQVIYSWPFPSEMFAYIYLKSGNHDPIVYPLDALTPL